MAFGRFKRHRGKQVWLALVVTAACSRTTDNGASPDPSGSRSEIHQDAGSSSIEKVSISLQSAKLEPGQSTEVMVQITPPGIHPIELALLGNANDAYLDSPQLSSDMNGIAKTRLTVVARTDEELLLQAKAGDERATATVSLNERATADISVVPVYAGNRAFEEWQVLWGPGLSCDIGYGDPAWNDAQTVSRPILGEESIPEYLFEDVPSRESLTVLVKAKSFAIGCAGGVNLVPQTRNRVEVPINQRFADVSQLAFPIEMNIAPESELWTNLLTTKTTTPYIVSLASKFRGEEPSDVSALLATMGQLSGDPTFFGAARKSGDWDSVLTNKLSPDGAQNGLSSRVQRWLQDGAKLLQAPRAFLANLEYHVEGERGEVELVSVAGKAPSDCLLPGSRLASISADAQDVLRIGFKLDFAPSGLFTCLADAAVANGNDAGTLDVLSALSADFDCDLVSQWMSAPSGSLYEGCDTACGAALCESALSHLWDRVVFGDIVASPLKVNAAGKSHLTDDARISAVDGSWVGTISLAGVETSVGGTLRSCSLDPECQSMLPF